MTGPARRVVAAEAATHVHWSAGFPFQADDPQ